MLPLHDDLRFTNPFEDDWIICRFHLDIIPLDRQVSMVKIDPQTEGCLVLLATATVGKAAGVTLPNR